MCHGGVGGNLEFLDKDAAYTALVGVAAMGVNLDGTEPNCADTDATRVVAGDPDASLLQQQLEGTQTCGGPMPMVPLPMEQVQQVRDWIAAGAMNN